MAGLHGSQNSELPPPNTLWSIDTGRQDDGPSVLASIAVWSGRRNSTCGAPPTAATSRRRYWVEQTGRAQYCVGSPWRLANTCRHACHSRLRTPRVPFHLASSRVHIAETDSIHVVTVHYRPHFLIVVLWRLPPEESVMKTEHNVGLYSSKAKSKYRNRIRLERASLTQSSDTYKTPYDRVKRCREHQIGTVQRHDGNSARLARRSDEALGVRVSVARIAPSLIDLGSVATSRSKLLGADWRSDMLSASDVIFVAASAVDGHARRGGKLTALLAAVGQGRHHDGHNGPRHAASSHPVQVRDRVLVVGAPRSHSAGRGFDAFSPHLKGPAVYFHTASPSRIQDNANEFPYCPPILQRIYIHLYLTYTYFLPKSELICVIREEAGSKLNCCPGRHVVRPFPANVKSKWHVVSWSKGRKGNENTPRKPSKLYAEKYRIQELFSASYFFVVSSLFAEALRATDKERECEIVAIHTCVSNAGRPRSVRTVRLEEEIRQHIIDMSSTSTRSIAR
ncbi:hypothetical protein PR048_006629 [Dryococelus australis]|uniref:Uncharacterized protein n=1 Tax=Dryococelus australis TaxID=614101 RepID=A0ABQ9IBH3_9NEOP|nr:hypothetical protein PR048_006629 [Dryococelus australis]